MLVLIFFQYISLLLMPFSSGLSLILPTISFLVIYFVLYKDFRNLDSMVKGHLIGQMMVGVTTVVSVIALTLTFGITQEMKQLTEVDKEASSLVIMILGFCVFLRYYYFVSINFLLFRKRLPYEKALPIPITKRKYDQIKEVLSRKSLEDSNIVFKKEGKA
ncbi:hypothetical protein F7Q91_03070 [Vibrio chagasii]|uniref:Uncharacterized protein n=1 Tax=Vibrio chagasii TaxID=170679 RepID=A0A7V7NX03_9VIBR|nr:hypothetical protein [Vibrio chagasii]KAB0482403.1 hypothetical protein F7Q91_03070 [Vibrio chagasii]